MTDDAGNLSIDFLAGFTIFMIAFIYVATMIPGLFINLQSKSIDYDAVAYRTGVILVEDPGMPYNPSWATLTDYNKGDILRFGLALSKNTPNILSPIKIDRFFCSTAFVYPDDYQSRAVFGDYPYQFNVSFQRMGDNITKSVGDPRPDGYGYSRRIVKIKEESNATMGFSGSLNQGYTQNATTQLFSVYFNYTQLTGEGPDNNNPAYQINPLSPLSEGVVINLTDLDKIPKNTTPLPIANLSSISFYRSRSLSAQSAQHSGFSFFPVNLTDTDPTRTYKLYIDGNSTPTTTLPMEVKNNVSLILPPGFLNFAGSGDASTWLNITMQFDLTDGLGNHKSDYFLNSTQVPPYGAFEYNYTSSNITQPHLSDGVLEVAVW